MTTQTCGYVVPCPSCHDGVASAPLPLAAWYSARPWDTLSRPSNDSSIAGTEQCEKTGLKHGWWQFLREAPGKFSLQGE